LYIFAIFPSHTPLYLGNNEADLFGGFAKGEVKKKNDKITIENAFALAITEVFSDERRVIKAKQIFLN
jgi:hypothetical protein